MDAKKILRKADTEGFVEISSGVYLNSRENIIADQKGWSEEDGAKNIDFSAYSYWITTDDGVEPEPVRGGEDLDG